MPDLMADCLDGFGKEDPGFVCFLLLFPLNFGVIAGRPRASFIYRCLGDALRQLQRAVHFISVCFLDFRMDIPIFSLPNVQNHRTAVAISVRDGYWICLQSSPTLHRVCALEFG